jgi:ABC-type polysaccharide/polyol phosphate export permease
VTAPPTEIWTYRNLIWHLTQRELRSRYKKSILGWLWSLINPAATLLIFSVVFGTFLRVEPPPLADGSPGIFALYLFAGLIVWNFFNGTVTGAMGALQSAGPLLSKVYFPPACPAIANMFTVLTQTALEALILVAVLLVIGNLGWQVILFPVLIVFAMLFALGVGLFVSIYNVYFRDVSYLVTIALQALFYSTPIIYTINLVPEQLFGLPMRALVRLNPITQQVVFARDIFYLEKVPTLLNVVGLAVSSTLTFLVGWWLFSRKAENVTEEL